MLDEIDPLVAGDDAGRALGVLFRAKGLAPIRIRRDQAARQAPELLLAPPVTTSGMFDREYPEKLLESASRHAAEQLEASGRVRPKSVERAPRAAVPTPFLRVAADAGTPRAPH